MVAGACVFLAATSRSIADASLAGFFSATTVALLAGAALAHYYRRNQTFPSVALLLASALLCRLTGVSAYPLFEDDFYRYLWDGHMTVEHGTPYAIPPSAYFDSPAINDAFATILGSINYPDVATVYGPTAQYLFAGAYLLAPGAVWPLQVACAAADVATLALLLRLAPGSPAAILYAFSPLLIKEFAFTAHPDVFGALFVTAALYATRKNAWIVAGILLACAAGIKVFALVAIPFVLGWSGRGWLAFTTTALLLAAPFGIAAAWLPAGLTAMAGGWLFNAPLYLPLVPMSESLFTTVKLVLAGVFAVIWAATCLTWLRRHWQADTAPALQQLPLVWLYGLFWLVLPVLNPWYLVWWLPFAVLRPALTPWVASAAVLLSYISGINLPPGDLAPYAQPAWAVALEFAAIAAAALYDIWRSDFWRNDLGRSDVRGNDVRRKDQQTNHPHRKVLRKPQR